jgi:hypothetical protein
LLKSLIKTVRSQIFGNAAAYHRVCVCVLLIGALYGSVQSVRIPDTVNIQIVLLKMSTAMLETC